MTEAMLGNYFLNHYFSWCQKPPNFKCKICACVKITKSHPCPKNCSSWHCATGGGGKGTETSELTVSKQNSVKLQPRGTLLTRFSWQQIRLMGETVFRNRGGGEEYYLWFMLVKGGLLWQHRCPPLHLLSLPLNSPFICHVKYVLGYAHFNQIVPAVCLTGWFPALAV